MTNKQRQEFRKECRERDNNTCVVPWCEDTPDEVHHLIERREWKSGGYIPDNGASVCNKHHRYAERNMIPPQAFWLWIGVNSPVTPEGMGEDVDKWGKPIDTPPWKEHRERVKYPSSRHLPFSNVGDDDDTYHRQVDCFLDTPLVVTEKIDGSNAMLIKDTEHPVRARNGKRAGHKSFDLLKDLYWENNVHSKIPENVQVFGEWVYAKHSIHYGCNCDDGCVDVGSSVTELVDGYDNERAYFQVFGVYHMEYDTWLSWPTTERIADDIGFPTTPVIDVTDERDKPMFTNENQFYDKVYQTAQEVINNGGEGVVVRSKFPYHYGQFGKRLGKYVRENHVKTDEHWKHTKLIRNQL